MTPAEYSWMALEKKRTAPKKTTKTADKAEEPPSTGLAKWLEDVQKGAFPWKKKTPPSRSEK